MKIEGEKTVNGFPALIVIASIVAGAFFYHSVFGVNPEKDTELQALLREDITGYLVRNNVGMNVKTAEAMLKKSSTAAAQKLIRTNLEKTLSPQITSLDLSKSFSNSYCGSDRQYDVQVRYKIVEEKSADLVYCLRGRKLWTRARVL